MKNNFLFRIVEIMMSILLGFSSISCAAWGEFSSGGLDKMHEEYKTVSTWYEKYLYFEMPEDEFIRLFAKDSLLDGSDKLSIISHKNKVYVVKEVKGKKYRITFENGLLVKFEKFGWEKIPIITANYYDYTYLLRGAEVLEERAKERLGFYPFMPEGEFLKTFYNSILSHSKNSNETRYVFIGKDGRKYRVTFSAGGYLIGME